MQISEAQQQQAMELAEKYGYKDLWANANGEFFTSANHAALSVGNDGEKWAKVDLTTNQGKIKKSKK